MAKFDLHQLLNERSKAAAVEREKEPRTADGMEQLTLDVYDLIPSQENFYSTQYINDLKQSIAIVGLLQPLLVEWDGDKFRVVAGHRRRLACMALVEDGLEQFRRVPCVTRAVEEEGTVKTILDRLALIFANGFREKSDWEKMEETLRTEALIAELRKEVEVEGRTRWITAEFTGITEAQIGRYKSIKNNLCPELMQAFKAKRLGVSTAYELSGLSPDYQARAADTLEEVGVLSINDAKALKQAEEARKPLEGQMELDAAAEGTAQTAQEAAQDAPEAAGGTDTTTEAEGPQNGQQAAQDTPQAVEAEKLVYVGPQLPRGRLKTNRIFEGTREQILASPEMAEVLKRYPLVKNMLVPVSKLAEAKQKIAAGGNALHKFYADIASLAATEGLEG